MKYVLDTDMLIYFLKGEANVVACLNNKSADDISITIVNHTELLFGAFNSIKKKENLYKIQTFLETLAILPFCAESSYIFAKNKALLKQEGNIIADLDLMIASITLQHDCILVSNNTKHFERIKGLKLENWR